MNDNFTIGSRIRNLRNLRDLKQKQLAEKFSFSVNTWSQYESSKRNPSIETLKKISEYFNVSIDYLVGSTNIQYDPRSSEFIALVKSINFDKE